MIASWPESEGEVDRDARMAWETLTDLVTRLRHARSEAGVEVGKRIPALIHADDLTPAFQEMRRELVLLARLDDENVEITEGKPSPAERDVVVVASDVVAVLPTEGLVDLEAERARLLNEVDEAAAERDRAMKQLGNASFVERAPEHVVDVQRRRLADAEERIGVLQNRLSSLEAS